MGAHPLTTDASYVNCVALLTYSSALLLTDTVTVPVPFGEVQRTLDVDKRSAAVASYVPN